MQQPTSILEELRREARESSAWLESIASDVTETQANWRPPGRANTIAATYAHIVRNQDEDMNHSFLARPMLAEQSWRGRTGIPPWGADSDKSEWGDGAYFDWPALHAYGRAVGEYVIEAVDTLTADDLRMLTKLSTPNQATWYGIDVVRLTVGRHVWMHGGEIACLKGLQGVRGYTRELDESRP